MKEITLLAPDDWHCHFRDDDALSRTVADTARVFARAIVMPNLVPPVTTVAAAAAYRRRLLAAVPEGCSFEPLMTLYLTDKLDPAEIAIGKQEQVVTACKYYPAGATTNSDAGVTDINNIDAVLAAMQDAGMPLLIHGEVTTASVDIFDRERVFIDNVLLPLHQRFPELKIVLEHISTAYAVDVITSLPTNVGATITAHHLLINRNDILVGGIKPHHYCLPIAKRHSDQVALIQAATSGNKKFFLGTDSAPHARSRKESPCGCAGIYTAHAALAFYAEVFAREDKLDRLEGFASIHGADFYGLPRNTHTVTLRQQTQTIANTLPFANETLIPFWAGQTLPWSMANE